MDKDKAKLFAENNKLKDLASQSTPSWNQIISWLKEMEMLRTVAA